jgi:hypothetical protein
VFRVGELVGAAARSLVGADRLRRARLLDAWAEVVGEPAAQYTRAAGIRGTTLVVVTPVPAVGCELRLRRDELVAALNRRAGAPPGAPVIEDLQVLLRPAEAGVEPGGAAAGEGHE